MQALLTSGGLSSGVICDALLRLHHGRLPQEMKVGFIPTAANVEPGNKEWFFNQVTQLRSAGYEWIDYVDVAAPLVDWKERLSAVDIVFVSGGNTFYLLEHLRRVDFAAWIEAQQKLYVGVSAGTIVASATIEIATLEPADPNVVGIADYRGFGWIDAEIEPHCDKERMDAVEKYAVGKSHDVYALSDEAAISIDGNTVTLVGDGWQKF